MYTSGWPKNQNRCCHISGWPPPAGVKNMVPSVRSSSSRIAAAVSTGVAKRPRIAVMKSPQTAKGMRNMVMPGARMLTVVVM